jgi:asparagine synthase (glutamine-hydrolysing)
VCGLYASIGIAPDPDRLDIVGHRGPDGRGWREFASPAGPVVLGHRRLSIIDPSDAASQPMACPSGRYHLVYNGELYNYLELRQELQQRGETFRTQSDSEVLLRAYVIWGEAALDRFRGMFAFVVWDDVEKRLLAARDRFAIKPLYLVATPRGIAFGSEIKQLLGLPGLTGRMNLARVCDFLSAGVADHTAETLFEGVRQLRGGECATVSADAAGRLETRVRRWYAVDQAAPRRLSAPEAARQFQEQLTDSVRLHLRSDMPVGSCLSGGLDSSSIVCLMNGLRRSGNGGGGIHTVSACFSEKSVDERSYMEVVVARTGAEPHYVFPRAEEVFDKAGEITWHQDEPFGSTSIFAQWCVFGAARQAGLKVMLDGQGADELLAGYHASYHYYLSDLVRRRRWLLLARTLIERSRLHGVALGDQLARLAPQLLPARLAGLLRRRHRQLAQHDWLGTPLLRPLLNGPTALETASETLGLPPVTDIATLCLTLTFSSNLPMLLHWEDRNSMAHSIEARVPFVDHGLAELALGLGGDHKIVGGETKRVLRRAMSGILPDVVRDRRDKLGFQTPETEWFRGPLRELARAGVEATLRRFPELFNAGGTRALVAEMLDGRRPVDFTLWRIINLGIWGERFGVGI